MLGTGLLLDYMPSVWGAGIMHHSVHAEKSAKSHCHCISLKELRGPMGEGGEMSFSH